MKSPFFRSILILVGCVFVQGAYADDQPQWGEPYTRNMISTETGLPDTLDLEKGTNLKWSVSLGNNAYGSPTIASGKVLIGANNLEPRDPRHQGDRGVLLCLDEADGSLQWQLVVPRITGDKYKDWPMIAMCSPPTIEGDRIYTLTNRFEVVCLDLNGMADGNDGPYQDEGRHMVPAGDEPMEVTALDADIIWMVDLVNEIGTYPHDQAHSSVLIDGPNLYLNTCNGVDNTHQKMRRPDAPSLIVLDKETGRLVAKDNEGIGKLTFHSNWSSPSLGTIDGQKRIFFGGGNGVCYSFEALGASKATDPVKTLKRIWRFDPDPTGPKENVAEYLKNREESPSIVKGMPVFYKDRIYVTVGGDIWWGKEQAWLKCIDASKSGDITETGEIWSYPMDHHSVSTPSIWNGLVFITDCGRRVHCLDAETGKLYWTHELGKEAWGSTLVADGKVYVGSLDGDVWVLAADKEKRVISMTDFKLRIASTPVAANGVLYVNTLKRLYAFENTKK